MIYFLYILRVSNTVELSCVELSVCVIRVATFLTQQSNHTSFYLFIYLLFSGLFLSLSLGLSLLLLLVGWLCCVVSINIYAF